jgi:hypothetical protein
METLANTVADPGAMQIGLEIQPEDRPILLDPSLQDDEPSTTSSNKRRRSESPVPAKFTLGECLPLLPYSYCPLILGLGAATFADAAPQRPFVALGFQMSTQTGRTKRTGPLSKQLTLVSNSLIYFIHFHFSIGYRGW